MVKLCRFLLFVQLFFVVTSLPKTRFRRSNYHQYDEYSEGKAEILYDEDGDDFQSSQSRSVIQFPNKKDNPNLDIDTVHENNRNVSENHPPVGEGEVGFRMDSGKNKGEENEARSSDDEEESLPVLRKVIEDALDQYESKKKNTRSGKREPETAVRMIKAMTRVLSTIPRDIYTGVAKVGKVVRKVYDTLSDCFKEVLENSKGKKSKNKKGDK